MGKVSEMTPPAKLNDPDLWAITSYFNPAGFKRRLPNYRIFRENLGIPLVTAELSFDGSFELTDNDADILIQISGGAVLWQKERLLNIALRSVPAYVNNIAWIDCDVIFERSDWADEAIKQLKKSNVVQLLSHQVDLGPEDHHNNFNYRDRAPSGQGIISMASADRSGQARVLPTPGPNRRSFAWGLAWAARRKILEDHGLYDAMIVGGGTRAMVSAMYGEFDEIVAAFQLNRARQEHYLKWARSYHQAVQGRVGHVPGRLYHLWHGKLENRNYASRHQGLVDFSFEPSDIAIGSNGAWQWVRANPDLEKYLANHFVSRAEDG
jgi:hypothetical protein